jgi:Uncharacterised nucleotidyltransferase
MSVDKVFRLTWTSEVLPYCADFKKSLIKRRLDSVPYLDLVEGPPLSALQRWHWKLQKHELANLVKEANSANFQVLPIKGAEFCERYFASRPLGKKGDVDVLIERENECKLRRILNDLGFVQANFDVSTMTLQMCDLGELIRHENNSFNLKSFVKIVDIPTPELATAAAELRYPFFWSEFRSVALIVVDVSFALDSKIVMKPLIDRSVPSAHVGARTLSIEDHLWYMCAYFYLKAFTLQKDVKLSLLCEIAAILKNSGPELDWEYLRGLSHSYDLHAYLYYNIVFLDALLHLNLDRQIFSFFDPRLGSRSRDFGWVFSRIFGELDPFPIGLIPEWHGGM